MFVKNDCEQLSLFDSVNGLTAREKKFLDKSWARHFSEHIFPAIDEQPFAVLYSKEPSRANTPVNVLIGACIIQQITDLSDEELLNSLLFDIRFQYALHTTNLEEQPLSDRSLGRFRARCNAYELETGRDLIHEAVDSLTKKIAEMMRIDHSLKRMDSMMIASNIKKMTRLELLYTCTANLMQVLKKLEIAIPEELKHYTEADDKNRVIYHSRGTASSERIAQILADAKKIKALADEHVDVLAETSQYLLYVRMLNEQTTLDNEGNYQLKQAASKISDYDDKKNDESMPNDNAESQSPVTEETGSSAMNSAILQNPADSDATYREKNGNSYRGYAANVTEESTSDKKYSIITNYQYDTNNTNDQEFAKRAIGDMEKSEEGCTIVADGLYHGSELEKIAEDKNITIVNTNLSGRSVPDIYALFEFDNDGHRVLKCPGGYCPKKCSYNQKNGQCIASFERSQCESCPYHDQCKPKMNAKTSRKTISVSAKKRAEKQMDRSTEEFKEKSAYRNGVETVPSFFRRYFHVDTMPVRGKLRTKQFFGFMVAASNIMKFCSFMNSGAYCAQN